MRLSSKKGSTATEYAILVALVGVVALAAVILMGGSVSSSFRQTETGLGQGTGGVQPSGPAPVFDLTTLPTQTVGASTYPVLGDVVLLQNDSASPAEHPTFTFFPTLATLSDSVDNPNGLVWSVDTLQGGDLVTVSVDSSSPEPIFTLIDPQGFTMREAAPEAYVVLRFTARRGTASTQVVAAVRFLIFPA
jgi:Flp pilus assembly pilin Flp